MPRTEWFSGLEGHIAQKQNVPFEPFLALSRLGLPTTSNRSVSLKFASCLCGRFQSSCPTCRSIPVAPSFPYFAAGDPARMLWGLGFGFVHARTQHVIVTVGIYSVMRVFTRPHHAKNALNGDICRMSAVRQKNAKTGGSFTGGPCCWVKSSCHRFSGLLTERALGFLLQQVVSGFAASRPGKPSTANTCHLTHQQSDERKEILREATLLSII